MDLQKRNERNAEIGAGVIVKHVPLMDPFGEYKWNVTTTAMKYLGLLHRLK